jgi:hypothetical protein
MIPCCVGAENSNEEEVVDNILTIYDNVAHHLINGQQNIRHVYLKLTMGKPVKIGEKAEEVQKESKEKLVKKEEKTKQVSEEKEKKK